MSTGIDLALELLSWGLIIGLSAPILITSLGHIWHCQHPPVITVAEDCSWTSLAGVDIIIPVRGPTVLPPQLVEQLQKCQADGASVVVLRTLDHLEESEASQSSLEPWGLLQWGPPPRGYKAGVLNQWTKRSEATEMVFLDVEATVTARDIERLVSTLRRFPNASFVQGSSTFETSGSWIQASDSASIRMHHDYEQSNRARRGIAFNMNGYMMALRRKALLEAGGFDETRLSEDLDLAYRLHDSLGPGIYEPSAKANMSLTSTSLAYRHQKIRWAFGRAQSLIDHRTAILFKGTLLSRLLNVSYFLEFAVWVPVIALTLLLASPLPFSPTQVGVGLTVITGTCVSRFLVTRKAAQMTPDARPVQSALGDALLRQGAALTFAVVSVAALTQWSPGWKWHRARRVLLPLSLALTTIAILLVMQAAASTERHQAVAATYLAVVGITSTILWRGRDFNGD